MKVCSNCGMLNVDTATFCIECGSALEKVDAADEFFSQSEKTTVINRDENVNGYVDGDERTTVIDPLNDVKEEAPKTSGLKLNLGDEPAPIKFRSASEPTPVNQTGYADEGYSSFSNNPQMGSGIGGAAGMAGATGVGMSNSAGPSYNSMNGSGYISGNGDNPSNNFNRGPAAPAYVSAPANNAPRNIMILCVLGVVVVLLGFLLLGGNSVGEMKVSNTPEEAMTAFVNDFNDLEMDEYNNYTCREFIQSDLTEINEMLDQIRAQVEEEPSFKFNMELVTYSGETEIPKKEFSAIKAAMKARGMKGKIGKGIYANCKVRGTASMYNLSEEQEYRYKVTFIQYDGRWVIASVDMQ